MSVIDPRLSYQPFEYPQAYEFWLKQQQAHWLHTGINMSSSVDDWHFKMTDSEKSLVSKILLGFTQSECLIGNYWAQKVAAWFPKPEIQMMAYTFASSETIHTKSYNYLSDSLGLIEHDAFLQDDAASDKLNNLMFAKDNTIYDKALSLAIYSGFAEGVSLFSSFAVLLNFSKAPKSLLMGVGDIIKYSVADESLHSNAGCWLFRTLREEFQELYCSELEDQIYEASKMAIQLENNFIDSAFEGAALGDLTAEVTKNFIQFRTNTKLEDLGLKPIYSPDKEKVWQILSWFEPMTGGAKHTDFFAGRVSDYSKGKINTATIDWTSALS